MTAGAFPKRSRRRSTVLVSQSPDGAATDDFPGLGRIEQLVLRGDGLTTTSLEILTGERVTVRVRGHWTIQMSSGAEGEANSSLYYDDDSATIAEYLANAHRHLAAHSGEMLLIREIQLVGPRGVVHGVADVVARRGELPPRVAEALASTDQPIGRLLRAHGVVVTRELTAWGRMAAGHRAVELGAGLSETSRVPGRTYVMRLTSSGVPLAVLTEYFAPHVFGQTVPASTNVPT